MTNTFQYVTIYEALKTRILSGEFAIGEPLPSIWDLQQEYGIASGGTIRAAHQMLAEDGMVRSEQGRRVFVTSAESAREVGVKEVLDTAIEQIQKAQRALVAQRVRRVTIDLDDSNHPQAHYILVEAMREVASKQRHDLEEGISNDPEAALEMAQDADWIINLVEEALDYSPTTNGQGAKPRGLALGEPVKAPLDCGTGICGHCKNCVARSGQTNQ